LFIDKNTIGISFVDISTGEFLVAQGNLSYIDKLLQGFKPTEVIMSRRQHKEFVEHFGNSYYTYLLDEWPYAGDYAEESLLKHFEVNSLKGFGIDRMPVGVIAAGVALHYLNETEHRNLQHISHISRIEEDRYMWLDRFTIRNLELIGSTNENAITLVDVLDETASPMGARLLKRWLVMPLKDKKSIEERLNVVDYFCQHNSLCHELVDEIKQVGDLERLISKIGLQKANPREITQLKRGLYAIENLKAKTLIPESDALAMLSAQMDTCVIIRDKIEHTLQQDPPVALNKGNVIADGVDAELDKLRKVAFGGKGYLLEIQRREAEATGIPSLKIACIAKKNYYVKPEISTSKILDIKGGRHPVIEKNLPVGEDYITNDTYLDPDTQQIIIITGPNMAGKSALLRQTGLIVLMAQIGCFVPAKEARVGLVDKIFTRVGASDNLSSGESTFMVEMNETASIMNNLSDRSLILLDEIGRGTSTYDGISIAWAIAEFLHSHPGTRAKTLFATHYHELNELSTSMPRIKNFNVTVKEVNNKVIFLRKLVPGGSEHSFGIHVAKLAGMPPKLIQRASEILKRLEQERTGGEKIKDSMRKIQKQAYQLQMFAIDDPILEKIRDMLNNLDVNTLTPVEALMKLDEIQRVLKN